MMWLLLNRLGSFEHPKHMFKLMDKKIIAIFPIFFFCLTGPMIEMVLLSTHNMRLD